MFTYFAFFCFVTSVVTSVISQFSSVFQSSCKVIKEKICISAVVQQKLPMTECRSNISVERKGRIYSFIPNSISLVVDTSYQSLCKWPL